MRTKDFRMWGEHDPQVGPLMLMGPEPKRAADAVLSILGAISTRMDSLSLE